MIPPMLSNGKIKHLWLLHFFADFSAIVAAYYTVLLIRFHSVIGERFFTVVNRVLRTRDSGALDDMFEDFYLLSAPRIIFFLVVTLCVLYALRDLYPGRRFIRKRLIAWDVVVSNTITIVIFFTYFYLKRNTFHPRGFFVTVIFFNVICCVLFRAVIDRLLTSIRSRLMMDQIRAVLFGSGEQAKLMNEFIARAHPNGIQIVDQVQSSPDKAFDLLLRSIEASCSQYGADMIIAADTRLSVGQIMQLLEIANRMGISVKVLSDKMNILVNQARIDVDMIQGLPLVHFEAPSPANGSAWTGNLPSKVFACVAIVLLSPLMALIALLIRLTSEGPVLFVQERIGVNRKPFLMYKFRTMYDRAEELQAQVEEFNESGTGLFKIRKDPRVTSVGRFLRRFSLDELPQLFNVLRGEMTIVGPRPLPRRDFENYYEEWHYSRHEGLPGLTCLWQVSGRSDVDFHNMCILDVYYLRNRNWILNLKLFLKTFWVVLFAKGAY